MDAECFPLDIRSYANPNPGAAGTTQYSRKTSIDILSGAVRQLPRVTASGNHPAKSFMKQLG
jgi:hypothetical protein